MAIYTFKLFSAEHIVSIVSVIALYILFLGYHEKLGIKGGSKIFPVVLSAILVTLDISEDIIRLISGHYSIKKDLPLQLCNIGLYVAVVALLKKNQTAFELIFYWGLVGASQAVLTPDGDLFELRIYFIFGQAYHGALILSVLWLMINHNMRMKMKTIIKVVLITNLLVIFISLVNYLLDSNYMFLRVRPNSASPFLMGDWPIYIIMVQVYSVAIVSMFIKLQDRLLKPVRS